MGGYRNKALIQGIELVYIPLVLCHLHKFTSFKALILGLVKYCNTHPQRSTTLGHDPSSVTPLSRFALGTKRHVHSPVGAVSITTRLGR